MLGSSPIIVSQSVVRRKEERRGQSVRWYRHTVRVVGWSTDAVSWKLAMTTSWSDVPRGGWVVVDTVPGTSDMTRSRIFSPRVAEVTCCRRPCTQHMSSAASPAAEVRGLPSHYRLWALKSPGTIMCEQNCRALSMPDSSWVKILQSLSALVPGL